MLRLHLRPDSAGMAPHAALLEAGADFEVVQISREEAQRPGSPFRALSPNGTVPALETPDGPLFEASAICVHVADVHPDAGLLAPLGRFERARTLSWLALLATTVQQAALRRTYPERYTADAAGAPAVRDAAFAELAGHFDRFAAELDGREWLVGDRRTIADLYLFMLVHWCQDLDPPAWSRPALHAHAVRCAALPSVTEMLRAHGLDGPPAGSGGD